MKEMTNEETSVHLRKWINEKHTSFSWPTDACGYEQHTKFVRHRNDNWNDNWNGDDWNKFVLDYADQLDKKAMEELVQLFCNWSNPYEREDGTLGRDIGCGGWTDKDNKVTFKWCPYCGKLIQLKED